MENFKNLHIWLRSIELSKGLYSKLGNQKFSDFTTLIQQVLKSSFSIPSNIAEGTSRTSQKDYARFLEIALGSAFELETQLLILQSIASFDLESEINETTELQKMINAFRFKKLESISSL